MGDFVAEDLVVVPLAFGLGLDLAAGLAAAVFLLAMKNYDLSEWKRRGIYWQMVGNARCIYENFIGRARAMWRVCD